MSNNERPAPEQLFVGEPVYLADAEPHLPEQFRATADLRARVILHVLFADWLVIGDSQSLNNPYLRQLLTTDADRPRDLAALVMDGYLRVARRGSASSFLAVRNSHADRGVDNVPSPEYARWLDGITGDYLIRYNDADVTMRFKSGLCILLEARAVESEGLRRTVLAQAHDWVQAQGYLLYQEIRDWQDTYPERSTEALLALRTVERCTSIAYRLALPSALSAAVADRRSVLGVGSHTQEVLAELRLPATLLSVGALSEVPIEVVQEALLLESRQVVLRDLARIRHGKAAGPGFLDAVTEFTETFHELALRRVSPAARFAVQWHEAKLRVNLTMLDHDGGYGVAFEVISPEETLLAGFFELFSRSQQIATDDLAQAKADIGADAISRAIALTQG